MSSGATFKRFDLHLHAPGRGQNFVVGESQGLNSPAERLAFARRYVRQAREEAQLDVMAITNHNDTSWIEPMRKAAHDLYGESLVVLPGVEIGTFNSPTIHVIVLFEADTPTERIERFLEDVGLPDEASRFDGDTVQPCQKSWPDLLTAVEKRNGIAIAAHACEQNGLLHSSVRSIVKPKMSTDERLLGIEIPGCIEDLDDTARHYVLNTHREQIWRRQRPIACLNCSDARRLADIGRRFTYVKCEQPSLEALRRALLDHQARLRPGGKAPEMPHVWLESLTVEPTRTGFLSGVSVELNPLLNCLIGGRGTGKSALIELIRYLWGLSPLRPADLQGFLDVFFPETAEASVEVTVDSGRYRFQRAGRKAAQVFRREGTEWAPASVRPSDVCPIDIYGQKEILYTSQNVRSQLDLLDRLVGDEIRDIKIERDELLLKLRRNREAMIGAYEEVQDKRRRLERKPAVEEQLKQYYHSDLREKAQTKRLYDRELQAWENAARQLQEMQVQLDAAGQQCRPDLGYLDDKEIASLPSRGLLGALRDRMTGLSILLGGDLARATEHLREAQADVRAQRAGWTATRAAFDADYAKALAALPGMTPDAVTRLERERLELEQVERDLSARCDELKQLTEKRRQLLTRLGDSTQRQFAARSRKAADIAARLQPRVSVEVLRAGDLEWLSEQFRRVLAGSRLRAEDYNRLADQASAGLPGILAAIENADPEMPDGVSVYASWLPLTQSRLLQPNPMEHLAQVSGLDDKANKLVEYLSFARRLELDELQAPDRAVVRLNIARQGETQEKWRSLGQRLGEGVSVGQGCTAILSIILLESAHPLIIDQPEDDLDNRFIYDEVVQILRRERGQRQMLIATHNANIPVAGDAEQIIALDAQEIAEGQADVRCKVVASGFVDTQEVSAQVQLILEGGKAAFQLRREKYGF
jgi:ABC-type Mn2+/Zn2+ transport system ATPase subunit